jgi:hypothetical protein
MRDLIHYAVRHAFDIDVIKEFDYLAEIPTQLYDFAAANGFGGKTGVQYPQGKDNHGNVVPAHEAKWFDMEWVSHWILPSAGQGYEMLHRLYPNSRFGPSPDSTDETKFERDSLKTLLRAQDIPPYWRDRLIALSYRPFTRVDIRRMFNSNILDRQGVYHAYRANGYDDEKAWKLTQFTEKQQQEADKKRYEKPTLSLICQSYEIGTIDRPTALANMTEIIGDAPTANLEMANCDAKTNINHAKKLLGLLQRRYVRGKASRDDTIKALTTMGIVLDKAMQYINDWDIDLELQRDRVTAPEILKWYDSSIIDENEAYRRLITLGYNPGDATNMMLVAEQKIGIRQYKALLAREKDLENNLKKQQQINKQLIADAAKRKKENIAMAKQMRKDDIEAVKASLKGISTKNLKAWFITHLITMEQVKSYLTLMGWEPETIKLWSEQLQKEIVGGAEQAPIKGAKHVATEQ